MGVVWILGAGASVGLGGPTLKTLLSRAADIDLQARFAEKDFPALYDQTAKWARLLYHYGRNWPEGNWSMFDRGELLWQHAEEYLDYLDTAAANPDGLWTASG